MPPQLLLHLYYIKAVTLTPAILANVNVPTTTKARKLATNSPALYLLANRQAKAKTQAKMNIISGRSQLFAHTLCIAGLTATTAATTHAAAHIQNADNSLTAPTTATATSTTLTLAAKILAGLPTSAAAAASAFVDSAKADVAPVDDGGVVHNVRRAENESAAATQPDSFEVLRNECYERLNSTTTKFAEGELYCAGTFDGWLCWPDTAAGTSAYERCPEFIFGFDPTRNAHKECGSDGEWYKHPVWNYSWTNYTSCVNIDDLEWKHSINIFYETGYGISLVAILLSLAILSYFKSLKCARITLHMNLFTSFAANNSLWLIWYLVVVPDTELLQKSPPTCIALHIILHYFLLTNYAWMLCEGFYLHTVLVSAFISEKKLVKWLIAFGWGSPAIVIFIYGLARGLGGAGDEITHCWMNSTPFDYIFVVPVCISMFLNLLFLCNIVRVVLLKLKAPASIQNSCGPSRTVLQAFRATLLLVPLLGLQYILTPFRPEPNHPWEHTYEVISAFTASFQGLCVATFFCFFNGEVIAQVKRKWRTICFSNRARANSYTATQVSFF